MTIQVEFWHLVALAISLIGAWIGGAKLFFSQVDRRLDERFTAQERDRQNQYATITDLFHSHAKDEKLRLDRLDIDAKEHGERLSRLEAAVVHMPSHDDLRTIHARLDEMAPAIGRIQGIEHLLHGINDYLRKGTR